MADQRKRISELPASQSTAGLYTIGVNSQNESVKVPIGSILEGYDAAVEDASKTSTESMKIAQKAQSSAAAAVAQAEANKTAIETTNAALKDKADKADTFTKTEVETMVKGRCLRKSLHEIQANAEEVTVDLQPNNYTRLIGVVSEKITINLEQLSSDYADEYWLEFIPDFDDVTIVLPKGVSPVGVVAPTADHRYLMRIWAGLACLQDMGYNEHRLRLTAETAGKVWVGTWRGRTNLVETGQTGNEMQMPDLQYSVDGGAWQQWPGAGEAHGVALEAGQVMRLKGTNVDGATGLGVFNRNGRSGVSFKASAGALMRVAGDVTCLLNGGVGGDVKLGNGCFIDLFGYSSINCDALVLPSLDSEAATYTYNGCYHDMFCSNTRTTRVHVQLSQVRYGTLTQMCYNAKSLNYIEVDGKNVTKNNGSAFVNVAPSGRFVVPAGYRASWEALIPAGWTVVEK